MKIKVEKEVNLPELIQWAWDNPKLSGNKRFYPNNLECNCCVIFDVDSILCNVAGYVSINDKFTIREEYKK
ncbi:hypothetical protein [Staphylococcus aureus]|uniref:hypothetical protein n=1 Tax=Staphylococcus aureus TaxID=1280 RepID=UPI000386010D|nr:hypothetical protein [Staphylococcus aureus]HDX9043035.1 hypothetical protein [Staphylococcus aureus 2009-60-800-3]EPZ08667.1 hypothetical protein M398_04690 [Staphylococcus aureus S130]EZR30964.1 hypothetical protein V138_02753 [Staphylococcus aureus ZTA11/03130-3ST]EZR38055.1 hypothetical protein W805_02678 [Staphylococcus aureus VET1918S]EZR48422.1 hypothetical protein W736_02267 [Staphylococcus aureus VET1898R]